MIYLAYDHNGFEKMKYIQKWLTENGYQFKNLGPKEFVKTDSYVDYVKKANNLVKAEGNFGIYMCGTGVGVSIAGNRTAGVRAVLANNAKTAMFSRRHNNANVLALGAGYKGFPKLCNFKLKQILKAFLSTEFEGGRHIERVEQLDKI